MKALKVSLQHTAGGDFLPKSKVYQHWPQSKFKLHLHSSSQFSESDGVVVAAPKQQHVNANHRAHNFQDFHQVKSISGSTGEEDKSKKEAKKEGSFLQ